MVLVIMMVVIVVVVMMILAKVEVGDSMANVDMYGTCRIDGCVW